MFQSTVRYNYAAGVRGEIAADGPLRVTTFRLDTPNTAARPIRFGSAFSLDTPSSVSNPNGLADVPVAVPGGTGPFAGILIHPKEHALAGGSSGPLSPTLDLLPGEYGGLCRMGILFAEVTTGTTTDGFVGAQLYFDAAGEITTVSTGGTIIPGGVLTTDLTGAVQTKALARIELTGAIPAPAPTP